MKYEFREMFVKQPVRTALDLQKIGWEVLSVAPQKRPMKNVIAYGETPMEDPVYEYGFYMFIRREKKEG